MYSSYLCFSNGNLISKKKKKKKKNTHFVSYEVWAFLVFWMALNLGNGVLTDARLVEICFGDYCYIQWFCLVIFWDFDAYGGDVEVSTVYYFSMVGVLVLEAYVNGAFLISYGYSAGWFKSWRSAGELY